MCSWREPLIAAALLTLGAPALSQPAFPGIGRTATPQELAAWDIDVRPDFKGLPPGSGSVAQGMVVWERQCASCHGVFGESNSTFSPLVGGTTAQDIESGRVARLTDPAFPSRSTLMKLSTLSTLWDYIRRAMPWNMPKSLSNDEVYAVTAYLLNLGGIVPDDHTLSEKNIAQAQARLPNRNGMSTAHGLWPGQGLGNGGRPDVRATACRADCGPQPKLASTLPEHARNNHGNLAAQNRSVGAQRGADTSRPAGAPWQAAMAASGSASGSASASGSGSASASATASLSASATATATAAAPASSRQPDAAASAALALAKEYNCLSCHGVSNKIVGPALSEVARKYAGRQDAAAYLAQKIQAGGSGVWGPIPMPPQTAPGDHVKAIASWLADGAKH